ncbi:transcription cofactor vestigial-like protein 1 [Microcaecilia unicolor]|uniref:Transcription cofactor vestigial-like protein 1 n=1 Tax=Microcaecilia unicolor TaxID=1415580 RepID=A0A6P7YNN7_9AMPH|nr:transcription cofactor vestigial-like protein 1 [Microcaecilia unicolor]XP_030066362.1 transcription cofactor vestigial-like protein 1 [Microcaecilia unicolor]
MEEMRKSLSSASKNKEEPVKTEWGSRCVVFTYFQGDINSVVDEHFSRALRNMKSPHDLSTKSKDEGILLKNVSHMSPEQMNFSPHWTKHHQTTPVMSVVTPGLNLSIAPPAGHYPDAVMQTHPAPSADLWHFSSLGTPNISTPVYHPHSVPEVHQAQSPCSDGKYDSLLNLLHQERYIAPVQESIMLQELGSNHLTASVSSHNMSHCVSPEAGIHSQDQRKDVFNSQDRRKDLFFY